MIIILDTSRWDGTIHPAEWTGNVSGWISKINSTDGDILHRDEMFDLNRLQAQASGITWTPYYWYYPQVSGLANYNWLASAMPAECKTIFVDVEEIREDLSPEVYGAEFNNFIRLCRGKWLTIIYTGDGFLPNLTPWPIDLDYWWAAWPKEMIPSKRSVTWDTLRAMIAGLTWPPWNGGTCPGTIKLWQVSGDKLIVPGCNSYMDISVYSGTASEYAMWVMGGKIPEEINMPNTLSVPHVSQIVAGALEHNNDCGAAAVSGILLAYNIGKATVDEIYNRITTGDRSIKIGELQAILAVNRVTNEYKNNTRLGELYDIIRQNRPAIALIRYGILVDAKLTERTRFRAGHFVTVIGMDIKYVYIHDPYSITMGNCLAVPINTFLKSWEGYVPDEIPAYTCIAMLIPIQDLSVPVPPPVPPIPPAGVKYTFGNNPTNGVPVLAVNVRSGPAMTYSIVKVLYKSATPDIYILQIQGEYAQLADKSGWVFIAYFVKT